MQTTFPCVQDTILATTAATTPQPTATVIGPFASTIGVKNHGLTQFDMTGYAVPVGEQIVEAVVRRYVLAVIAGAVTVICGRVMYDGVAAANWDETKATWNRKDQAGAVDWGAVGCSLVGTDYFASPLTYLSPTVVNQLFDVDVKQHVLDNIAAVTSLLTFVELLQTEVVGVNSGWNWQSQNGVIVERRPVLIVTTSLINPPTDTGTRPEDTQPEFSRPDTFRTIAR